MSSIACSSGRSAITRATSGCRLPAREPCSLPTAEADQGAHLWRRRPSVCPARGFAVSTPEEQSLVERHTSQPLAPSCVIGTGLAPVSSAVDGARPGAVAGSPFLLDPGGSIRTKAARRCSGTTCAGRRRRTLRVPLVLAGPANMPIPDPSIRFLGYVDDGAARRAAGVGVGAASCRRRTRASASSCWKRGIAARPRW